MLGASVRIYYVVLGYHWLRYMVKACYLRQHFRCTVKSIPVLGSPISVLGMRMKRDRSVVRLFLKINF